MDGIDKINKITETMQKINAKFKLLKLLRRAKEEYDKNNYKNCIETCSKMLETNPNNPVALRGLGCSQQFLGNYNEAIEYFKEALKYSESKEIEYTLIGTIYYLQDKFEEALKNYNLAIETNDSYEQAYEGRNQTLLENHLILVDLQDKLIEKELRNNLN